MRCLVLEHSVIICSRNRASSLSNTLESLSRQSVPISRYEVIVVNNGSTDETASVINQWRRKLPLVRLFEPIPSKARSLNRAIEMARGQLLVFTDDDVSFSPKWLEELECSAVAYSGASIFCGPVVPQFPDNTPHWLLACTECHGYFGAFTYSSARRVLPQNLIPYGANYAVRRVSMGTRRFRHDLGPSLEFGPNLGEDTEFIIRVRENGSCHCVYIPSACVTHHVASHQVELQWIQERAFYSGKAFVVLYSKTDPEPHLRVAHSLKMHLEDGSMAARLRRSIVLNYLFGQLSVLLRSDREFASAIWRAIDSYEVNRYRHLLGPSATEIDSMAGPNMRYH